jgi:hypothetical protein
MDYVSISSLDPGPKTLGYSRGDGSGGKPSTLNWDLQYWRVPSTEYSGDPAKVTVRVVSGHWPPRKGQRARSQQPKVRNQSGGPSQITDTTIHQGQRVMAEGPDQGGALYLMRWITQRSLGQHPISPHSLDNYFQRA